MTFPVALDACLACIDGMRTRLLCSKMRFSLADAGRCLTQAMVLEEALRMAGVVWVLRM